VEVKGGEEKYRKETQHMEGRRGDRYGLKKEGKRGRDKRTLFPRGKKRRKDRVLDKKAQDECDELRVAGKKKGKKEAFEKKSNFSSVGRGGVEASQKRVEVLVREKSKRRSQKGK